jgi:CRISPR/Cas system CMR-associated protein Cmr3 (group 5 of RAMP superfamily)
MGIFSNNKLKVKIDHSNEVTNFNINYNKLKNVVEFKVSLLKKLIGNNFCLVIIDSKLQYKELNGSHEKLKHSLEELDIPYEEKSIKEDESVKVLGIPMKVSGSTKTKRWILGIVTSSDCLNYIMDISKGYNIYYYFDFNETKKDELLQRTSDYLSDEDEFYSDFGLGLFDGIAFQNMNIKASAKYINYVNDIIKDFI